MTLDKVKLKTINNTSIIGEGNITITGGGQDIELSADLMSNGYLKIIINLTDGGSE